MESLYKVFAIVVALAGLTAYQSRGHSNPPDPRGQEALTRLELEAPVLVRGGTVEVRGLEMHATCVWRPTQELCRIQVRPGMRPVLGTFICPELYRLAARPPYYLAGFELKTEEERSPAEACRTPRPIRRVSYINAAAPSMPSCAGP